MTKTKAMVKHGETMGREHVMKAEPTTEYMNIYNYIYISIRYHVTLYIMYCWNLQVQAWMSWRRIAAVTGGNTTAQAVNFLSIFNLIVAYVRTVPAMYKTP